MATSVLRLLLAVALFALILAVGFASSLPDADEADVESEDALNTETNNASTIVASKTRVSRIADDCPVNTSVLPSSNTTDVSLVDLLGMCQTAAIEFWRVGASSFRTCLQPCLKAWEDRMLQQCGQCDAFSCFSDTFSDLGRSGLSFYLRELELSDIMHDAKLSERGAKERRSVLAHFRFRRLLRDYPEWNCAERNALPMTWLLSASSREGSRSRRIDVNAIPLQLLEDGSCRIEIECEIGKRRAKLS